MSEDEKVPAEVIEHFEDSCEVKIKALKKQKKKITKEIKKYGLLKKGLREDNE